MIIEIFIVLLITAKFFGVVDVTWTIACVICFALISISIQMYLNRKSIYATTIQMAQTIDTKLDDLEFRLESKEDRKVESYRSEY